ncbi:MAG: pantoate--beta-alanine ligase [Myxococcales bacterium FL481]|nr:MAG: pantoate--beta-alanine ligase [Myxococcales bacterium FL481]
MALELLRTSLQARAWREAATGRVGVVPTMGYLHAGHQRLISCARERVGESGQVIVTVFVNPAQFDRREDLEAYPRDEARDCAAAEAAGADAVFIPRAPTELYPAGAETWVEVKRLDARLCGATRPGHFRGVCTVLSKFWGLLRPDVSVYGEKDYQQLAIVRRLHRDLFLSGEVVGVPTVREADGLALSSRNARLTTPGRRAAVAVPRYLAAVRARFDRGVRDRSGLLGAFEAALAPGRPDYVDLVDADSLDAVDHVARPAVCALAVFFDGVRLIDNVVLDPAAS